jgi:hypothetical protein
MKPNYFEDYPTFIKRCNHEFQKNRILRLKGHGRDVPFLIMVDGYVQDLIEKYSVMLNDNFDKVYDMIADYVVRTGNYTGWEYFITRNELERILQQAWQELGYEVHKRYHARYSDDEREEDEGVFGAIMATALLARFASLGQNRFNNRTIRSVQAKIDPKLSPEKVAGRIRAIDSSLRSKSIATTELGVAQAVAEAETMKRLNVLRSQAGKEPIKKYWLGVLDDRIRDSHLSATQFYNSLSAINIDDHFVVNGNLMKHPRDPSAPPEEVVNCRCYLGYIKEK